MLELISPAPYHLGLNAAQPAKQITKSPWQLFALLGVLKIVIIKTLLMAKYVDGFVLVVPKDKTEQYKKMAAEGRDMWMKYGALGYYECRGDDLAAAEMGGEKARAFTEMAGAASDETVWFSYIIFKSKEHRNEVNAKVMEEMNKQMEANKDMPMPFDMKRMAYGGFQVEIEG